MKKRRMAAFLLIMALAVSQLAGAHGLTVQAALTGGEAGDSTETNRKCTHENKKKVEKAATCNEEGKKKHYYCKDCDGYFWDEACKQVIEASDVIIPVRTDHSYKNEIKKATATKNGSIIKKCTVCGKTTGSKTVIYTPKTVKLSWTTKTYTGKYLKVPTLTVKGSSKSIDKDYYTVTGLKKQKKVGTYTVTVKFNSKYYTGIKNKTLTFSIVPKTTSISKTTAAKKGFTVTWKKQSVQTSGYKIQYATNKDFKKAKTKTISSAKTTSYKITKLSANKKYWVRIRTYKKVSGKKLYSSWSKAVTVKTK